ncbi:MAG: hypothetical protein M1831_004702 [Alyxoria varia]|nr:MAG: hypothetical protein M1831_004702 [Alyxoria varia]
MCGISVIVALEGQTHEFQRNRKSKPAPDGVEGVSLAKDDEADNIAKELDESLDYLIHRGPDSRGQWISPDKRVALGHVRLAIIDLSPDGAQPMHSPDETVHAVVNGEFYDHDRIRQELIESTGYKFKGHSDSEIVIALYKHYGLSFLSHLRGEFSLCLYDSETRFFVAARDRYGIKPLFWTIVDGRLLIAAEAKAFLPLGWEPEWDVKSLMDGGWSNDQRTVFQNVHKVRPGHYLTCNSFGHIEASQYWDLSYPNKRRVETRTDAEMIAGVRQHMLDSIKLRLRADVPVGIYLSGGIDSSVIAGMTTHLVKEQGERMGNSHAHNERVSCFGIAFGEDSGYDESSIADRTAKHLDVAYHKILMDENELARRFEDATWHTEHHFADLNTVGKFALSELPRAHGFKVVLTGEGADENFGGYPLYLPDYLREADLAWPSAATDLPDEKRTRICREKDEEIAEFYENIGADGQNREESSASRQLNNISTVASMAAFSFNLWAPWTQYYGRADPRLTIAHNANGRVRDAIAREWHPLHSAQYVWTKGHLTNIFLTSLGDRTEMAHSVEARTPFLDHELTEYVSGLPPSVKIRYDKRSGEFVEKWILREAARPFITNELYERKKHAYSAPTSWPEGGPLRKLMDGLVTKENVEQLGFVSWEGAKDLVRKAFVEKDSKALRFTLLVAGWVVLGKRFGVKKAEPPQR